jgi:hypothetical protein
VSVLQHCSRMLLVIVNTPPLQVAWLFAREIFSEQAKAFSKSGYFVIWHDYSSSLLLIEGAACSFDYMVLLESWKPFSQAFNLEEKPLWSKL